ncbi:S-formylglutathione hydrolase FrmB [Nocardia tenerifensis]|uniref:S-formylglutathione hydrolase FrmB n=1 Tax=Nocardia tenerifensis TaxID=228006 RepID=A0A318KNT0_9NOCA|nr:alpha/beta hydrolase family protein [Nocardia tenerifensis]PXX71340.1 S-formylglutathione hydrolase FrmB [Nocardia tenerifensis]
MRIGDGLAPRRGVRAAVLACAVLLLCSGGVAFAEPDAPIAARASAAARESPNGSRLVDAVQGPGRVLELTVYSAAMGRPIAVEVLPAADDSRPAPVLYLLNGIDGGTETGKWSDGGNWLTKTDAARFFADQQVTVVMPVGGGGTLFADWRADDPVLGRQRWGTFLTAELPAIIDSAFHGTGANAIAGPSMASSAVFRLALAAPGRFRAIGSYSGCVRTSDPLGQAIVAAMVVGQRGDPRNLWGPLDDPAWAANDPYLHVAELRDTTVYVSTGTGQAGPLDTLDGPGINANPLKLLDQLTVGGMLDGITAACTAQLRERLRELNIPATVDERPTGTHSWGYWQQDLHNSWPLFRAALGG